MKTFTLSALLCCCWLGANSGFAQATSTPPGRSQAVLVTLTASVESINSTNREVTLKGPLGNLVTVTVDARVRRFSEIKVGDLVRADYFLSVAAELRAPTPEEERTPFVWLDAAARTPTGETTAAGLKSIPTRPPAAGAARRFKVVATVEALDRPAQTVTVQGPIGNYFTARVADVTNLTRMKIGDKVVLTGTEAVAISLEPAPQSGNR